MSPLLPDAASGSVVSDLSSAGFGVGTGVGIGGGIGGGGGGDDRFLEAVGGNGAGIAAATAATSGLSKVRRPNILLLYYVRCLQVNNARFVFVSLFCQQYIPACCIRVRFSRFIFVFVIFVLSAVNTCGTIITGLYHRSHNNLQGCMMGVGECTSRKIGAPTRKL